MSTNQITKHFERKTIYHAGIGVTMEVDYLAGTISMLDAEGKPKKWVFAGREVDYMAGWQNILDAMKHAVEVCERELRKHQDAQAKELKQKEVRMFKAIAEHNAKEK